MATPAFDDRKGAGAIALAKRLAQRLLAPLRAFLRRHARVPTRRPKAAPAFGVQQLAVETAGDVHSALGAPEDLPPSGDVAVRGWVAAPEPVLRVVWIGPPDLTLPLEQREDVKAGYGNFDHVRGFAARLPVTTFTGPFFVCRIELASRVVHRVFGLRWTGASQPLRAERRARLAGLLQCPMCGGALAEPSEEQSQRVRCERCGAAFPDEGGTVDCLPEDLKSEFGVVSTENVSAHEYDAVAEALLGRHYDGLVLDCGAGLRTRCYPNVVNYEIVRYPTTDVLGVGERLPFRSEVFDAVISLSVLEHVRDPFTCAREILRVLKPEGELYCNVPLLEPVHGYPNHYYNMTSHGLRNLFEPGLVVDRAEVLPSGWPIFALTWMLRRWADALSGEERRRFLAMRVGDLTGDPTVYWHERFVKDLPVATQFELAATTMIVGHKRSEP
jgi:SAM-dependent methyltransferase